jgi:hypothetical protein
MLYSRGVLAAHEKLPEEITADQGLCPRLRPMPLSLWSRDTFGLAEQAKIGGLNVKAYYNAMATADSRTLQRSAPWRD